MAKIAEAEKEPLRRLRDVGLKDGSTTQCHLITKFSFCQV